ncbi:glycosyltransferase [Clostridium sp. SM-530-WT-3G]|uniref:glycosyltransferase n=1 Tax=Clostridium sp. SM-530-WT-3G TaxID=2725303 RepID=UPI00145D8F7D|nr:glycosyltransferase [Clostridium sp. SM-530-WT-3G]NME83284.1 glycosyltransferase [Clostridium sp. SM-530-WT-3G]
MGNCLVLLTKVYPFDKGEEFIEDEIKELSNAFDKVILIATSTADNAVMTRKVPENFEVHRIKSSFIKKKIIKNSIKLFCTGQDKEYISKDEKYDVKGSLKKRVYLEYFIAKGLSVYDECMNILKKTDISSYENITFYSYWLYDTALAAIKLNKLYNNKRKKTVSRAHRYDLYADKNSMNYIPLRYYILENIDSVYPCSDDGSRYLKKLYPKYSNKIKTSYLGTKDHGIAELKDNKEYTIASCCHVSPVKRVDLLAKSLKLLNDDPELKIKWIHFGDGAGLDEIKTYAQENLTNINVDFKGNVKNVELMNYYKNESINLFVNTSSSEGLPVSIMEACSFGIPIIATDVGGTSEIVIENKTGMLLDVDFKPEDLSNRIKKMALMSKDEELAYRKRCREFWQEHFFGENNFKKFTSDIK